MLLNIPYQQLTDIVEAVKQQAETLCSTPMKSHEYLQIATELRQLNTFLSKLSNQLITPANELMTLAASLQR